MTSQINIDANLIFNELSFAQLAELSRFMIKTINNKIADIRHAD